MSNCFCFIPAKLGSTRFKEKNIAKLEGKELIGYSIKAAIESNLFDDEIIVSSESEKVLKIATKFGAKIPYIRDPQLAKDPSGVKEVLLDFLEGFPRYKNFEFACLLLPTAPLLSSKDIIQSFEQLSNGSFDLILSVCETSHNTFRSVEIKEDRLKPIFPDLIVKKSQELNPTYRINGAVIFLRVKTFLARQSFFTDNTGTYLMPQTRSVDIDSRMDLDYAQFLVENGLVEDN